MPDAAGNTKGSGYTAKQAAGWERCFGPPRRVGTTKWREGEQVRWRSPKGEVVAIVQPGPCSAGQQFVHITWPGHSAVVWQDELVLAVPRRLPDPVRDTMPHAAGWPRRPRVTTPSEAVVRSREYLADLREDGPQ